MKKIALYPMVLLAASLVISARAGQDKPEPRTRLQLDLSEGSRIIGCPTTDSTSLQTPYARMNVLWKEVLVMQVGDDHETVRLCMRNGDRFKGVLLEPIKLETAVGMLTIGIEHIREISPALCELVVTPNVPVSIEMLMPGVARLSGGYAPSIDKISAGLQCAQFIRVPWKSTPSYKVTVVKPGLLCQIQNPGNLHQNSKLTWVKDVSELSGAYLNEKYWTLVEAGQSFEGSGYELSLIAKKITVK